MSAQAGKPSAELFEYLSRRRSVLADNLVEPGPTPEQLKHILTAAARVPDHGKLCPFYFLVFEGEARAQAGEVIAKAYRQSNPDCSEGRAEKERQRFMRVPLVVGIIMRARMSKNPLWEQILTAGAAAQNFSLATHALGFGVQWLSEWYAYDDNVRSAFGLDDKDVVAGFMYVGSVAEQPEERDRPDLGLITNHWQPDAQLQKGDQYSREKFGYPVDGFDFTTLKRGA